MSPLARFFAIALLLAPLAGCGSLGSSEPHRYFVLEPARAAPAAARSPAAGTVRLGTATASGFYDTEAIVYSRAPGTRGYYQFNSWTERPGRRIGELLAQRLDRNPAQPGPVLNIHLLELYHDAAAVPGTVRVSVAAELVDPARRAIVGRKVFSSSAPAATYDAAGAVHACNLAVAAVLDQIESWAGQLATSR